MKQLRVAALAVVLSSCSQPADEFTVAPETGGVATKSPIDTAAYTVSDTTKFKFDFALANIPSPASAVQNLNSFGVLYNQGLLNNPEMADSYTTEQARAINLGIFNIDMAYAMLNEKGQDVLNFMKSVLYLGEELGLRNAVSSMVGQRAEKNLNNRDSLFTLLDEIFVKSDSYLRNNERVYTATLIFAGSWLESLHLTCQIGGVAAGESSRKRARRMLWEQRFHLGNLITILNDYKHNPECAQLLADLRPIHGNIVSVRQDTSMSDETFSAISGQIAMLRKKWTST